MDKITIIYNENFFKDELAIIILVVSVSIFTILTTMLLVIKELKERGK